MGEMLEKARKYEIKHEKRIAPEERPLFHLTPPCGWMNDPNGFSFYQGKYHLFFQYYPYASHWDSMHWGHAVSTDLLHWQYLPAALAPDQSYDRDGCFSGSAAVLPDGRQLLMYTGVRKEMQPDGKTREIQTQAVAVGDGTDFRKYPGNPVLTEDDLPLRGSRFEFRDPKLLPQPDGSFLALAANLDEGADSGRLLLFRSPDGFHWQYERSLVSNEGRYGKMWECPDLFPLDGKWVILTSPQDMLPEGMEFHNGNGTLCITGDWEAAGPSAPVRETEPGEAGCLRIPDGSFREEHAQAIDYGIDFYAPQTIRMPDGRRVMIGWMQNWDACAIRMPEAPWAGQMSVPRELQLQDGRLLQRPVRELKDYRDNPAEYRNVRFSGDRSFQGIEGRIVDLELTVEPVPGQEIYHRFAVNFAEADGKYTQFSFRPHEERVKIDRTFSGSRRAIMHQRYCRIPGSGSGCLRIRMILDRYSVEVFINDGSYVMTATMYTDPSAQGISFHADGEVSLSIRKYSLVL